MSRNAWIVSKTAGTIQQMNTRIKLAARIISGVVLGALLVVYWTPINEWLHPGKTARAAYKRGCEAETPDEQIHLFTKAIEADPTHAPAYSGRGLSYMDKDQMVAAIADFNKAIGLAPDDPKRYIPRSLFHAMQGDYDKAWADAEACQRLGGIMPPNFMSGLREKSGRDGPATRPHIKP